MTAPCTAGSRTLLLGTDAPFSSAVFSGLVRAGIDVVAVGVDGEHPFAPLFSATTHGHRETLASLAKAQGLPFRAIPDVDAPEVREWILGHAPDFILVACFSQVLPEAVCASAGRDCLNLHPSLLPRYRGPAPLFWQLRAGEQKSGITLHRVAPKVDTGPILGQVQVDLVGGLDGAALEERFAEAGARLFLEMLGALPDAAERSQAEAEASWQPHPSAEDFRIDPGWCAQRAFDFMRGTAHWGQPYPVTVEGHAFLLRDALGCEPDAELSAAFEQSGDSIRLRCSQGVLHASMA